MVSSGVWEVPGGGKLGGGIEVSMVGSASAGDGAGAASGVTGAGDTSSMGANLATEAETSLLRAWSLLRDGIVGQLEGGGGLISRVGEAATNDKRSGGSKGRLWTRCRRSRTRCASINDRTVGFYGCTDMRLVAGWLC